MSTEEETTFWEHAGVLRAYLLVTGIFFALVSSLVFIYGRELVIAFLLAPVSGRELVFLSPLDPFLFGLRVSIYAGVGLSLPLWLGLFLHFVSPALPKRKTAVIATFVLTSIILSFVAIFVTYYYVIPPTFAFLMNFIIPGTTLLLSANAYLSFILLELGVVFFVVQLPLILNLLTYARIVNPHVLARQRRLLYVGLLIALAVATPTPDALTLVLVWVPAIMFLEAGLAIAKATYDNREHV